MKSRVDLRADLGVIVSRADELIRALQALPASEDAMQEALDALNAEERQQMAAYVGMLAQKAYLIRQESLWLKNNLLKDLP